MRLPISAIVEFSTPEDMLELAKLCDELVQNHFADSLRSRSFYKSLCARIDLHHFVSFGNHDLYQNPYWDAFVNSTDPQFMYCSVQHLLTYAGFLAFGEDEGEVLDLDGLL